VTVVFGEDPIGVHHRVPAGLRTEAVLLAVELESDGVLRDREAAVIASIAPVLGGLGIR